MSFWAAAGLTIFILILFAGIFLNFVDLPGTVVIFFDVVLYAILTGFQQVGWQIIVLLLIGAVVAESLEFFWTIRETPPQEHRPLKSLKATIIGAVTGAFLLTPFWAAPGAFAGFLLGGLAGILMMEIIRHCEAKIHHWTLSSVIFNTIGKNAVKGFISLFMIAFSLSNIYS